MEFTSALPPLSVSVPRFTCVSPVNEFQPLKVNSLAPLFTNPPGPLTTPDRPTTLSMFIVVVLLSIATPVIFRSPLFTTSPSPTVPDRINPLAAVRAVPESLLILPVPIVTFPTPNPLLWPRRRTPLFKTIPPLNVFDPLRVNAPDPFLVSELLTPLTVPPSTTSLSTVSVRLPPNVAFPARTSVPPSAASPSAICPVKLSAFETVLSPAPSPLRRPAFNRSDPVPNARSLPSLSVPAVSVVPPLYEFVPLRVSAPKPFCSTRPTPASCALYVNASERLNASVPSTTILPAILPPVPPAPSTSAPAVTVVVPAYTFEPVKINVPSPILVKAPEPDKPVP